MNNILYYSFTLHCEHARARRISDERRQEIEYGLYSHHINPFREMMDMIRVKMFLQLPPNLGKEEGDIVARHMTELLRECHYRITDALDRHKQEKENKKGSKDEHSS